MIVVLNINMAVDKTFYIPNFENGQTFRANPGLAIAGGKGVNVTRVLKNFTDDYMLFGICLGFNGMFIRKKLLEEKIRNYMVFQRTGESRVCISIINKNGISTDLNEDGCEVDKKTINILLTEIKKRIVKAKKLCISGRNIKGANSNFYKKLMSFAKKNNVETYVDLTGNYLNACMKNGVNNVKINAIEFREFSGLKSNIQNIKKIYFRHKIYGLKSLIITDKHNPIVAIIKDRVYKIIPPKIKKFVSGVGAGDSFMAGFIYSVSKNKNIEESLKFATACASSDCVTLGAGIINKADLKYFYHDTNVKKLEDL